MMTVQVWPAGDTDTVGDSIHVDADGYPLGETNPGKDGINIGKTRKIRLILI